jgi:membrane protein implicated in regulation of membrane protease activity
VLARYLLFQVPGWIVAVGALALAVDWGLLSEPQAGIAFALWLVKDAVLFPVLRRAYEPDGSGGSTLPIGRIGVAEDRIADQGWVRIGAELWRARRAAGAAPIERGARVRVTGARGFELRVEPEAEGTGTPEGPR